MPDNALKADLHLHTAEDPRDEIAHSAADLLGYAADLGFRVIAITNHDAITWSDALQQRADRLGIVLLTGVEMTIRRKHVLALNVDPGLDLRRIRRLEDIASLRREDVAIIAPHPFFPMPSCLGRHLLRHLDLFDGLEHSHFWSPGLDFNRRTVRLARRTGLPLVGTSDTHVLDQFGRTFSWVDAPHPGSWIDAPRPGSGIDAPRPGSGIDALPGPGDIIAALKAGRVRVESRPYRAWQLLPALLRIHLNRPGLTVPGEIAAPPDIERRAVEGEAPSAPIETATRPVSSAAAD